MDEQKKDIALNSKGEPVIDTVLVVEDLVTDGETFCQGLFDRIHEEAGFGPAPVGPITVIKEANNG